MSFGHWLVMAIVVLLIYFFIKSNSKNKNILTSNVKRLSLYSNREINKLILSNDRDIILVLKMANEYVSYIKQTSDKVIATFGKMIPDKNLENSAKIIRLLDEIIYQISLQYKKNTNKNMKNLLIDSPQDFKTAIYQVMIAYQIEDIGDNEYINEEMIKKHIGESRYCRIILEGEKRVKCNLYEVDDRQIAKLIRAKQEPHIIWCLQTIEWYRTTYLPKLDKFTTDNLGVGIDNFPISDIMLIKIIDYFVNCFANKYEKETGKNKETLKDDKINQDKILAILPKCLYLYQVKCNKNDKINIELLKNIFEQQQNEHPIEWVK